MSNTELTLLIAEDDDFQRSTIVKLLNALGISDVFEASNGEEALEILNQQNKKPIDILITDLKMPRMDGIELLRNINLENHHLGVIILTGMDKKLLTVTSQLSKLNKTKLLGAVEKPINLQQLNNFLTQFSNPAQKQVANFANAKQYAFTVADVLTGISKKQFKPYLQPKVNLKTGKIVGAEALARWLHPEHGVISPFAFIPLLEQNNCIDELTFCMLEESALACKMLIEKNFPLNLAINLSLVSLNNPDIAKTITQLFYSYNVDPKYITLEITESAAMTDGPIALENLARLYMSGFTLSIDDYGTGYSNLQQLTRIAFGELKVDQSFVQGFASNDQLLIVVASNIDMAHKLGIKCVAEGVETKEDWDLLKSMGCDFGQGYYIAKPMPVADFYQFASSYNPSEPLPLVVNQKSKKQKKSNAARKILVVDDDQFTRNIIERVLSTLGFVQITSVASVASALTELEKHQFDIIITDVFMPDINGLEFIKRIRTGKTFAKAETRIIILSGMTEASAVGAAIALDVNGILVKPLVTSVVDQKIDHVLSTPFKINSSIGYESISTDVQKSDNQKAVAKSV
jgi:EAL domain-containing protein (putative c-di-GMP-specific phosphodiesterase class I)/PleD family two-component response regulator